MRKRFAVVLAVFALAGATAGTCSAGGAGFSDGVDAPAGARS